MEQYWMCITNKENWIDIKKILIWGVNKKNKKYIETVKIGDKLLIYIKGGYIAGLFESITNMYNDESNIYSSEKNGTKYYPYRIKLKKILILEEYLKFNKVLQSLNFIKNKDRWGSYLFGRSMIRLNKEDYSMIIDRLLK